MSAYIKNTERSQINNLMLHLKLLKKKEQAKTKTRRKREIIKIRAEINEIETTKHKKPKNSKPYRKSVKPKAGSLKKITKINKCLANLTKMRRGKTQINKISNEKWEITTNTKEIQGIIRNYFENLYSNGLENLEEMDKFLDTYGHPELNQEAINHVTRSIMHNEIEAAIKSPQKEKSRT
jgi:hypothetical protein